MASANKIKILKFFIKKTEHFNDFTNIFPSRIKSREPLINLTGDDIPDVLVGMLSQTGFKVMQKCNF